MTAPTMRRPLEGDPFGIAAAQAELDACLADRDIAIVMMVRQGTTHKVTAELFGLTAPRVTQIVTAHRDRAWGPAHVARVAGVTHASMAEDMRTAVHAQQLRAEAYGLGYKAETAAFYGSEKVAQADSPERRLTLEQARREHAARLEAERERAESYRARKARRSA